MCRWHLLDAQWLLVFPSYETFKTIWIFFLLLILLSLIYLSHYKSHAEQNWQIQFLCCCNNNNTFTAYWDKAKTSCSYLLFPKIFMLEKYIYWRMVLIVFHNVNNLHNNIYAHNSHDLCNVHNVHSVHNDHNVHNVCNTHVVHNAHYFLFLISVLLIRVKMFITFIMVILCHLLLSVIILIYFNCRHVCSFFSYF